MKTVSIHSDFARARSQQGATLVEMMVNIIIFSMAVAALITVNLFGQFQNELVNSTLGASDQTRTSFNQILDEIRSGVTVQIGSGTYANFIPTTNGLQQGDTLQITPTTNLNCYIYYYFATNVPTNGGWLIRALVTNSTTATNVWTLATTNIMATCLTNMDITKVGVLSTNLVTNALTFQALAFNGTNFATLTNDPSVYSTYNYLVVTLLQFYQYQYPLTQVGSGSNYLFNYYQVQLAATRHSE